MNKAIVFSESEDVIALYFCNIVHGTDLAKKGAVASIKVLIQLFQKLAGIEGTESLVELRRGRNTQDTWRSSFFASFFLAKGKKKNYITEKTKRTCRKLHFYRKYDTPLRFCGRSA